MTRAPTPNPLAGRSLRAPIVWGVVFGVIQAASPLGFWWLDPATVYALSLTLIAAVYIGFAVADGRPTVIAVEAAIAAVFVIVAAAGVTGPTWLLVAGLAGHGFKDLWQHRSHYVNACWRACCSILTLPWLGGITWQQLDSEPASRLAVGLVPALRAMTLPSTFVSAT
jgi:hypothetical protein